MSKQSFNDLHVKKICSSASWTSDVGFVQMGLRKTTSRMIIKLSFLFTYLNTSSVETPNAAWRKMNGHTDRRTEIGALVMMMKGSEFFDRY